MARGRPMALVPMVVEQTPRGERAFDIFSRLRPEAAIEKRRADGLDVGEVKAHNMPWIGFVASVFNVRIDPADRRAQYVCLRSVVS